MRDGVSATVDVEAEVLRRPFQFVHIHHLHEHQQSLPLGRSVSIIHLHGVENRQDHQALNRLSDHLFDPVLAALRKFSGTVSLEIFSFEDLESSLNFLEKKWIQAV